MTRKNQQQIYNDQKIALTRARTARDVALRSINKILTIAEDDVINAENRPILEARILSLDKLVTTFNNEQQQDLSVLAEANEIDQFTEVDEDVTESMQSTCDRINLIPNCNAIPSDQELYFESTLSKRGRMFGPDNARARTVP
ncbi:hypothetical protein ACI65C_004208 [Semiaphis heraclei]